MKSDEDRMLIDPKFAEALRQAKPDLFSAEAHAGAVEFLAKAKAELGPVFDESGDLIGFESREVMTVEEFERRYPHCVVMRPRPDVKAAGWPVERITFEEFLRRYRCPLDGFAYLAREPKPAAKVGED